MNQPSAEERKHHPYSPSTLQAREVSPHWQSVNSDSEASRAGTLQHGAVDKEELPEELSDVQALAVVNCKNYWAQIALDFPGGHFLNEVYLPIDDEVVIDPKDGTRWQGTTAGYLDRGIISADYKRASICDWKFGQWSVEPAETNLQGIAYALGLLKNYPSLEEVDVHFYLPHRKELTHHTFKRSDFEAMYLRVRTTVQRAIEANRSGDLSKCNATVSSCLFCANVGKCPLVVALALKVGKKYHPVEIPDNVTPNLILDPAEAEKGMELASLMGVWAKAYRSQATAKAIENDSFIPDGYKLTEKAGKREIADAEKTKQIAKEFGLTDAQVDEARKLTLTPLFYAARANAPRGSKEAAEKELSEKLFAAGAVERADDSIYLEKLKT